MLASDDLNEIIGKWSRSRTEKDGVYKKLESYRKKFYEEYNEKEGVNFKHRDYKLYISYSNDIDKKKGVEEIRKFKEKMRSTLVAIGMNYKEVKPGRFIKLIKELANYPEYKEVQYRENDSISDQIGDVGNAMLIKEDGIMLKGGEYETRVYEVKGYPKEWTISEMPQLLGDRESDSMHIPSRFAIIYTVSNEVLGKKQEAYKKKGEMVVKQLGSFLDNFNRTLKEEGDEWQEIIKTNLKKRERFLRSSMMVLITAKRERIEFTEQALMSLWRKNDFILSSLRYFQLVGMMGFCPYMNKTELGRLYKGYGIKRTVMSSEAKALMPINGEWKGSDNGGIILTGKRGQIFAWNNFEGAANYNTCVIGESGSGKSVFLQELVMAHLAQGTRVFVVDIGRSFKKTCEIIGGDHVTFGSGSKVSLNPFTNIQEEGEYIPKVGEDEIDEDKIDIVQDSLANVKKIVQKMAAPVHGTTDMQNGMIGKCIKKIWDRYKSEGNINRLLEALREEGVRGEDLELMLFEFSSEGSYGKFFEGEANIKFDKQLTVLEFEELREQPELGGVIMQMLAIQIVQQIYLGDRSKKFVILFDEAWYVSIFM